MIAQSEPGNNAEHARRSTVRTGGAALLHSC